jgi:hypothetical protein
VDPYKNKITTVAKHGPFAVWAKRSIERLGYERDLYIHTRRGVPVSVENVINKRIETPISTSDTWAKIASGGLTLSTDLTNLSFMRSSGTLKPETLNISPPH